ncbi:hypothetical protein BDZ91DRAFT_800417 [Kalaharituber pfeilii]|nr:hypothetical protein BDZ91DRAFT_800417 [Kalaharituber pfeilii]
MTDVAISGEFVETAQHQPRIPYDASTPPHTCTTTPQALRVSFPLLETLTQPLGVPLLGVPSPLRSPVAARESRRRSESHRRSESRRRSESCQRLESRRCSEVPSPLGVPSPLRVPPSPSPSPLLLKVPFTSYQAYHLGAIPTPRHTIGHSPPYIRTTNPARPTGELPAIKDLTQSLGVLQLLGVPLPLRLPPPPPAVPLKVPHPSAQGEAAAIILRKVG